MRAETGSWLKFNQGFHSAIMNYEFHNSGCETESQLHISINKRL